MSTLKKYIQNFDPKTALRITNVRIVSQIFFFSVFFISVCLTSYLLGVPTHVVGVTH